MTRSQDLPNTTLPLPQYWEYRAPAGFKAIDFLSDLHLSAQTPKTVEALEVYLANTTADAILCLGDFFEAWIGDDAADDAGFEHDCADMLAKACSLRPCSFMVGNRDFLVGTRFLQRCGLAALPDPTVLVAGDWRVLLTHGDVLCLADAEYQAFRAKVRAPQWRADFLAKPLDQRRAIAAKMRDASQQRQRGMVLNDSADIDIATAVRWLHESGTTTLVHGHTHRPGSEPLTMHHVRHVLSDWDLDHVRIPRAEVLRLSPGGFERIALATFTGGRVR
jgi:UDP-2,3-diacylglucosamine hydrolase